MTFIIALSIATSVSGLNCRWRCAWRARSEPARIADDQLGAVASTAFLIQVAATGWFTVGFAPMMITTSALRHVHHRVADRARADAFEQRDDRRRMAQPRAVVDVVAAEAGAHELLEQVGLLVAALGRAEAGQRLLAVRVADLRELAAGEFERFFPARFAEHVHHAVRVHHEVAASSARLRAGSAASSGAADGARSRSRSGP